MTCGDKALHILKSGIPCQLFSPRVIVFLVKYIGFYK